MSSGEFKVFFGKWYGKVILAVITAIAVAASLAIASVPFHVKDEILTRIESLEVSRDEGNVRMMKVETNIEWIVRRLGGTPQ